MRKRTCFHASAGDRKLIKQLEKVTNKKKAQVIEDLLEEMHMTDFLESLEREIHSPKEDMWYSIEPSLYNEIRKEARKKGMTVSQALSYFLSTKDPHFFIREENEA